MGIKTTIYKGMATALAIANLVVFSDGCAVQEYPAPIKTPVQSIDTEIQTPIVEVTVRLTPEPTPEVTPEPTLDLTFRKIEDVNNDDIVRSQAQLIFQQIKNSDVKYKSYFEDLREEIVEDLMICLKWFSGYPSNKEPSTENIDFLKTAIINRIMNDEMWTLIDILEGNREPIKSAQFVGFLNFIPKDTNAYALNNRLEEIKIELAAMPSRERQLELAQEINDLTLSYMLSYEKESKNNYYGEIETEGYKIYIIANLYMLFNIGGYVDMNYKAQYPGGHEKYPEYMEADELIKKFFDFSEFIWGEAENRIIVEIENNQQS